MPKFRFYGEAGHVNAESPTGIPWPSKTARTYKAGEIVCRATGDVKSLGEGTAATNLTNILGLVEFEQDVKAGEDLLIREIGPHTLLETIGVDPNARVAGTELDLTAAGAFATDSVSHVMIMRNSTATEPTVLRVQSLALSLW